VVREVAGSNPVSHPCRQARSGAPAGSLSFYRGSLPSGEPCRWLVAKSLMQAGIARALAFRHAVVRCPVRDPGCVPRRPQPRRATPSRPMIIVAGFSSPAFTSSSSIALTRWRETPVRAAIARRENCRQPVASGVAVRSSSSRNSSDRCSAVSGQSGPPRAAAPRPPPCDRAPRRSDRRNPPQSRATGACQLAAPLLLGSCPAVRGVRGGHPPRSSSSGRTLSTSASRVGSVTAIRTPANGPVAGASSPFTRTSAVTTFSTSGRARFGRLRST
jgi:hypothetical protein